jgi:hypothetical protein
MENEWNRGRNLWISRMVLCNGLICEGTRVTGGGSGFVVIGYGIYLSRHTIKNIYHIYDREENQIKFLCCE